MRILILGGGVMQFPAVRLAKARGWNVAVAAAGISGEIEELADCCERVDLRDREAVTETARKIRKEGGLDGVFTAGTDFSTTVAWVAGKLGLPGIPYECALAATDKARMRAAFRAHGVPSPEFFTVQTGGAGEIPGGFSFPLVVKPVDNMGARGVRRVDDGGQLRAAVESALGQSASGLAIVEQYLEGPELSLDALIREGSITICGVADRHICFAPYFVEMGHTMPSNLPEQVCRGAEEVFRRGIQALGISLGAAKGDIKITPDGPVVGEIAARLSGGYMSGWTYPMASGVEVTDAALNLAAGLPPGNLRPRRHWVSAERAFISIPGTVDSLEGLEDARNVPGVEELFLRVRPGQQLALPINNMGKCGNLISKASSRPEALEAVESALRCVIIRLRPADPRTDAFLRGEEQAGFAAFGELSPDLRRRIEQMPPWIGTPQRFSGTPENLEVLDIPEAAGEPGRDWHGWNLEQALRRALQVGGVRLQAVRPSRACALGARENGDQDAGHRRGSTLALGRVFWNALVKGGVQAGVYVIDSLCDRAGKPKNTLRKWLT